MRLWAVSLTFATSLLFAPATLAAPICVDKNGDAIRCGVQGAMPVGWAPSPQQLWTREVSHPLDTGTAELLKAAVGIGLFLALIALLPEFDGSRSADWDKQEGDD